MDLQGKLKEKKANDYITFTNSNKQLGQAKDVEILKQVEEA